MCLLFHSQCQKMEDVTKTWEEKETKANIKKNTQKPGPRNQAMREHFKYPGTCASYFYGTKANIGMGNT